MVEFECNVQVYIHYLSKNAIKIALNFILSKKLSSKAVNISLIWKRLNFPCLNCFLSKICNILLIYYVESVTYFAIRKSGNNITSGAKIEKWFGVSSGEKGRENWFPNGPFGLFCWFVGANTLDKCVLMYKSFNKALVLSPYFWSQLSAIFFGSHFVVCFTEFKFPHFPLWHLNTIS